MIRNMISRLIQDKQDVKIYCQLGTEKYAYMTGIITEYRAENDTIKLVNRQHPREAYIPLTSIHTIIASE